MLKNYNIRVAGGLMLITAGALALLQTLGFLPFGENLLSLIFAVLFAMSGILFLGLLINGSNNWWAVIPGCALLGLGSVIAIDWLLPHYAQLGGSVFLGLLGISFWIIYIMDRQRWWAIIPGGVLITLAVVAAGEQFVFLDDGSLFFLGLAATFGLLYFLPAGNGRMKWAWIPAVALLGVAGLVSSFTSRFSGYFLPVILIGIGFILAFRSFNHKQS